MFFLWGHNQGGGKAREPRTAVSPCQYVAVRGDVEHPGIYLIGVNCMADVVIKMALAGGQFDALDKSSFSAMPVNNGDLLDIRINKGIITVTKGFMPVSERLLMKIPLDISRMTETDFDLIPGIGPAMAHRIAEYRQNNGGILRVEDLSRIEGVGDKKFKTLYNYLK